jgi:hypothetical protein
MTGPVVSSLTGSAGSPSFQRGKENSAMEDRAFFYLTRDRFIVYTKGQGQKLYKVDYKKGTFEAFDPAGGEDYPIAVEKALDFLESTADEKELEAVHNAAFKLLETAVQAYEKKLNL